jgi:hypothetical protein
MPNKKQTADANAEKKNSAPIRLRRRKSFLAYAAKENSANATTQIFFVAAFQRKLRPHPRKYLKLPDAQPHAMLCDAAYMPLEIGLRRRS